MSLVGTPRVRRMRALAHPLRLEMLSLLTGVEMSAAEVGRELGVTQANASYHLRLLLSTGLVEVASEAKVNGGAAKRYRARWDAQPPRGPDWSDADTEAETRAMVDMLSGRMGSRLYGHKAQFTDADLWVTPEVWAEVLQRLEGAARVMHECAQPPRTEGAVRANLSVMAFRLRESR